MSLLGKQGWRLLSKPESLTTKLYKARYFPKGNFIDSKLENNPSFVWRSIWEVKSVVLSRVRWRVGSGESISILGQPWLHDDFNPYIIYDKPGIQQRNVQALFKTNRHEWDVDIIRDLFNSRDQQNILKISLTDGSSADEVFLE